MTTSNISIPSISNLGSQIVGPRAESSKNFISQNIKTKDELVQELINQKFQQKSKTHDVINYANQITELAQRIKLEADIMWFGDSRKAQYYDVATNLFKATAETLTSLEKRPNQNLKENWQRLNDAVIKAQKDL
jgi:hypothetical protein